MTDEESDAAIAKFGCDCPKAINALRQTRGITVGVEGEYLSPAEKITPCTDKKIQNDTLYNNFNVKLSADLGKRNTLTLSTLYLGKDQGVPGGVPIPEPLYGQGYFNSLTDSDRKYT